MSLIQDAGSIIRDSIKQMIPGTNVREAIKKLTIPEGGKLYVIAVGTAAYSMAKACYEVVGKQIYVGVIITKYKHMREDIPHFAAFEAGHPVVDQNGLDATQHVLDLTDGLTEKDRVLFLLSGGAGALFEKPLVELPEYLDILQALQRKGADHREIDTVRKRLSAVKGGKFALHLFPAKVHTIVLSDVVGDKFDLIGSGPTYPDLSSDEAAIEIIRKYEIPVSDEAAELIRKETPKQLKYADIILVGNVARLVKVTAEACEKAGYEPIVLSDNVTGEARSIGQFLGGIAKYHQNISRSTAYIVGGETTVNVSGNGVGGRNQELVLSAAEAMAGVKETAIFSIASDGIDGPTDAAGAFADGKTREVLSKQGIRIADALRNNDSYTALKASKGLIITGPTGTNVNDISVVLIKR